MNARRDEGAERLNWKALAAPYPQKASAMLPILHEVQARRGCISLEDEVAVAEFLGVPPTKVHEVVTFYDMFHTEPQGRHVIQVCRSLSCHLRGAERVRDRISAAVGIQPGRTTDDGRFTVRLVECLAACDRAPVVQVGQALHGPVDPDAAARLVEDLEEHDRESLLNEGI